MDQHYGLQKKMDFHAKRIQKDKLPMLIMETYQMEQDHRKQQMERLINKKSEWK
jgi:hypothetical protein